MKPPWMIPTVGLVLVAASVVLWRWDRPSPPTLVAPAPTDDLTVLENQIANSLQVAHPTQDQILDEIQMLSDYALLANEDAALDPPPLPPSPVRHLPPSDDATDPPDFDLPALEARFLAAFEMLGADERREELRQIASFLASRDVATATRFMTAILGTRDGFTDGDAQAFATQFVEGYASTNPVASATWSEMLPEHLRYATHQILTRQWAHQDPAGLESWYGTLADPGLRANVIRTMSHALSIADDTGYAADWAKRLAENPADGPRLADVVVTHWSPQDPAGAQAWATSLPSADNRELAVVALTTSQAATDPGAAADWAQQTLQGDEKLKSIQVAVSAWATNDPAAAARWVERVADPRITDLTFDSVSIAWIRKDEASASAWIEQAAVADHRKEYVYAIGRQ